MLSVLKMVLAAVLRAAVDALNDARADWARERLGAAKQREADRVEAVEKRTAGRRLRDRLHTDPEFAKRVRDRFRDS